MPRLILLLLGLLVALPAWAVESSTIRSPRASATLLSAAAAVAPGQSFQAGLRLVLAPGWHSYWRNAGDAGAAPELTLALPAAQGEPLDRHLTQRERGPVDGTEATGADGAVDGKAACRSGKLVNREGAGRGGL